MKGTFDIRRFGRLPNVQLEPKLLRGIACLRKKGWRRRVGRVDERQQPLQPWHDLLVELELLDDRISRTEDPGQVPTRVVQALYQAGSNRIGRVKEDHRDPIRWPRCRSLRGPDGPVLERDDDVHSLANECCGLPLDLSWFEIAPDQLDPWTLDAPLLGEACHEIALRTVDPSQFSQTGNERAQGGRDVVRSDMQQADAWDGR